MCRLRKTKLILFLVVGLWSQLVGAQGATAASPVTPATQTGTDESHVQGLDLETYRTRIEPIFLKQRQDGVRCYDCHSKLATRLRLQPLSPGSSSWTEEQSRRNFAVVSQLITPSQPLKSRLLLHPLAQEAGGDPYHTGGKFWVSEDDPEWKMLADWVGRSVETEAAVQGPLHSPPTPPP